ncbi:MAG TPA: cyanophycinase [Terriglobales bacterium]|jgi:cyanophycinase
MVFLPALALAGLTYWRVGKPNNVVVKPRPGYALIGGGPDIDEAFRWMCQLSSHGDFLILRASGTDAYNSYVAKLCPDENSVATLLLPSREAALDPAAARDIDTAAALFIAGGDQSNYVNFWAGTPVQRALNAAIARGVPIGGTSAGLALLGEYGYSAQNDRPNGPDLTGAAALANPFDPQIVIERGFVHIPTLRGVIFDTHFHTRNRMGRLLAFLARNPHIRGIGVDQQTALLMTPDGVSRVAGIGSVYLLSPVAKQKGTICQPGSPLTLVALPVTKRTRGQPDIHYTLTVTQGKIAEPAY